jgi:RNA polymerase sigma factor (sigma-70 family)
MTYICDEKRNILSARPYFRERQTLFTPRMIPVFKRRHAGGLHRFHFNHSFIRFVMTRRNWAEAPNKALTKKILKINQQIVDLRSEIATMNLPLAISRARIFFSWTPQSHLQYMDLVQISAEGLLAAIDKFCLPFSRVFRSVCIGRITGDFIEGYNQTSLHFYPQDKRKIYKAAKLRARQTGPIDFEELADRINAEQAEVNGETPGGEVRVPIHTDASEISRLLMATALVSADAKPRNGQDEDMPSIVESVASDESLRPDVRVEASEAHNVLQAAISELPMKQQKLFRMRGI